MEREGIYSLPFTIVLNKVSQKMSSFNYHSINHRDIFLDRRNGSFVVYDVSGFNNGYYRPDSVRFNGMANRVGAVSRDLVTVGKRIDIGNGWNYLFVRVYDNVLIAQYNNEEHVLGRSSVNATSSKYPNSTEELFRELDQLERQLFISQPQILLPPHL